MAPLPAQPKIYHILHIDRLASVIADGYLWCDAVMVQRKNTGTTIGLQNIKQRRLALPVHCHPGDHVGDYVPFNFCPRSVMLNVLYYRNHPELAYRDGQELIVHLEADLHKVVAWAEADGRRWAFSLQNASALYAEFRCQLNQLSEVNWSAVRATNFSSPKVKEAKQAGFLIYNALPWLLVERIGVYSGAVEQQVKNIMGDTKYCPLIEVCRSWYY